MMVKSILALQFVTWPQPTTCKGQAIRLRRDGQFERCDTGYGSIEIVFTFAQALAPGHLAILGEPLTPEAEERYTYALLRVLANSEIGDAVAR